MVKDTIPSLPGFGPIAQPERIETLDILRGFALLCILIVNWSMNTLWNTDYWDGFTGTADIIANYTVYFFLDEKSWPMFAFLFGLGLSIQMQRAESRGSRFITVYSRRLVILLLIGAAHYIFTERDILFGFAITGFYLLLVRKLNLRLLIGLALISFTYGQVKSQVKNYKSQKKNAIIARDIARGNSARTEIHVDSTILDSYVGVYEGPERTLFVMRDKNEFFSQLNGNPPLRLVAESTTKFSYKINSTTQISFLKDSIGTVNALLAKPSGNLYRKIQSGQPVIDGATLRRAANRGKVASTYATGTFGEIVSMRAREFWKNNSSWTRYLPGGGGWFSIFLLGLYAGRRRIFDSVSNNRKFIKKVMCWGLIFGLTVETFDLVRDFWLRDDFGFWFGVFRNLMEELGSLALALGYLAALTLLLQRVVWKKKLAPFAPVGQMALTNYLLQSVVFVLLFFGYGLGWFGKVGPFVGLMLALLLFALQIVFSRWWLRHFRFGPVEWLWRSLTYWKRQPMKKS